LGSQCSSAVEQRFRKPSVAGSIPAIGSTLYRRNGGRFYVHDSVTGKQESLGTSDRVTATRLLHSKNEASNQPAINLQIARAYLAAMDPQVATRTWQFVMDEMVKLTRGGTKIRWETAKKGQCLRYLSAVRRQPAEELRAQFGKDESMIQRRLARERFIIPE
jgi:hypothetical protein